MNLCHFALGSSLLIFVFLNMLFCVAICGDAEHGINYNNPNAELAGLSKHGQKAENDLYNQIVNKKQAWHRVGESRVRDLRFEMARAQGARNDAKRHELQVRKELDKTGSNSNSNKPLLRTVLKHFVDRKEKKKDKIRNIVSDAAVHKAHGNFNEADVTRVVSYPWGDSHGLGYHQDARITSTPGYKSRSPSPPTPSRSQSASPSRSS